MFSGSGLFWLLPFLLLTINAKEKPMAEKKVVGRLVNTVSFQTDRASLQKALADIKKVKDAMKGLVAPANAMRKQTAAMKQQVTAKKQLVSQDKDWLIVQRAINKNKIKEEQREKRILDSKAKGLKLTEKQTKANQRQQQIARKEAVARLTQGSGMKVNDMLFMRMSKQAEAYNKRRDDVLSRRDSQRLRRRINRSNRLESLHGQALGMNAAYDRRQASIHSRALAENAKRDRVASQNTANGAARRKDMFEADRFNLSNRFGSAGNRRFDEIASRYAGATSSLRMYRQEVSALRRDLSSAANAQRGFNGTMKDMRSAFVQMTASYTAFAGLMGIADVGKQFQGYESAMTMGFGGEANAAPMIKYLQDEVMRLGLDIQSTTDDFSKLAVAAKGKLKNEDIQSLFSGYMEFAKVAGAGKERTSLGIRAIQQMLSKGQIMAEEFRSQMAEQVVGSDKAFRMAVEEMLGRALKKGELEEMMQKRMLDPEVLLPLVGKYFSQLANDGDALKKKLTQLETIEMRMKAQWTYFVRSLYDNGVEEALKKLYKGLARVFNSVKQLASSGFGHFLKGALDMISETVLALLDVIQIIVYLIDQAFGSNTDAKAFAAEILGMVVAAAVLAKIFIGIKRTMMAMVGLSTALGLGGGSGKGIGKGIGGFIGKVMIIGFASEALGALTRAILDIKDNPTKDLPPIEKQAVKSLSRSDEMWWPIKKIDEWFFGSVGRDFVDTASIRRLDKIDQIAAGAGGPRSALYTHIPPTQNVNVNITMDKNAKEIIKAEVQQSTQQQINSLIPPSARSR